MKNKKFSVKRRLESFKYAFNGVRILVREEHNARIHLFATISVLVAGYFLGLSQMEWIAIFFSIGLVISFEAINSAVEHLADFISPQKHEKIKKVKDLSAAAVLVSALVALITGLNIFVPKLHGILMLVVSEK